MPAAPPAAALALEFNKPLSTLLHTTRPKLYLPLCVNAVTECVEGLRVERWLLQQVVEGVQQAALQHLALLFMWCV